jgi:hypothetical protein
MIVSKHNGLGWILGSGCFCDSAIGKATMGPTCWTVFPCSGASSNYGGASNPNTVVANPQYGVNEGILAQEIATGTDPNAPNPNCVSTIINSPIAVCDWLIYVGVGVALWFVMSRR